MNEQWTKLFEKTKLNVDQITDISESIFFADLHDQAFKTIFFDEHHNKTIKSKFQKYLFAADDESNSILRIKEREEFQNKVLKIERINKHQHRILPALLFFTRPISGVELCFLMPTWCSGKIDLAAFKKALELFRITFPSEAITLQDEKDGLVQIDLKTEDNNLDRVFALTSFQTNIESWKALVADRSRDPDPERYHRLSELINSILRCKKNIDYVLFPELSIPRSIVVAIATRLITRNISLVTGVEYEKLAVPPNYPPTFKGIVKNQLIYFLAIKRSRLIGQVCIIQEKVTAAQDEAKDLYQEGGKILIATDEKKYLVNHGGLFLSGLICNDLLNIDYRKNLRGKIDALIVIEWNKDVETYDALITATANDLHCFAFQVNNRLYGDTRLRAPYKESYMRDRVRVRGGELDYFVVAGIEVKKLREFQSKHVSTDQDFKPVPTGFEISPERKIK
jgi:hypothetical protein